MAGGGRGRVVPGAYFGGKLPQGVHLPYLPGRYERSHHPGAMHA